MGHGSALRRQSPAIRLSAVRRPPHAPHSLTDAGGSTHRSNLQTSTLNSKKNLLSSRDNNQVAHSYRPSLDGGNNLITENQSTFTTPNQMKTDNLVSVPFPHSISNHACFIFVGTLCPGR